MIAENALILDGRFRTFNVDPKDLAGPRVDNSPHQMAYTMT